MTDLGIGVCCGIELGLKLLEEDQVDDIAGDDGMMRRELLNFTEVFNVAVPW
jgi:hypothetical protein